ncbi:MAG TPA: RNA polymerase sigma factor, partial [Solirubrobacterales bacterium]|nr:RNA polymerase sigma factor [Solirubrobacterales bacterium]
MNEALATGAAPSAGLGRLLSDERLSRRAAAGDERAFAAIFDRYHQRLYRYCVAIVGDPQDAQDALQNTMVKVLRALPGEERRIDLKPWLYRIAHNESIELLRRRRETRELDDELAAPGPGLAEEAASRERLRRLLADLDELPERQRGALVMRELAGLEFAEIATALGTSPAVARQTLYEARLGLRQMDEGREMSCAAVLEALSEGDGRVGRRRDLRAHLRGCPSCRRFGEEIESRRHDFAALSPLPAVAAVGLLQGLLGGGSGTGGGVAAAVGAGAAKSVGASVALKGATAVAVVAAIGVGAADRGGLIDAGLPGGGSAPAIEAEQPAAGPARRGAEQVPSSAVRVGGEAGVGNDMPRRELSRSQAVSPGSDAAPSAPAAGGTNVTSGPAPGSQGNAADHPSGKGHEKQPPAAASHGQETAAIHKAGGHGSRSGKSRNHP